MFLYLIIVPLQTIFRKNKTLTRFSTSLKCIEDFDTLLEEGNVDEAISHLRMAPFFDIPSNSQLLTAIKEHHQELLSRYLILSDTLNIRTPNLAKLETLYNERNELLQMLFKSRFNFEVVLGKRKSEGKTIPNWTKVEFEKKEAELKNELKKNFSALRVELHYFFKNLEDAPRGEVLIH
jgi:hypothetical protein